MINHIVRHPEIMLWLGIIASYIQCCIAYADAKRDLSKAYVFCNLWRIRWLKTSLAAIGSIVGFAVIPLLTPFFPDFYGDSQKLALVGIFSFAAGYAGGLTIDKLVSKYHKYIDKL